MGATPSESQQLTILKDNLRCRNRQNSVPKETTSFLCRGNLQSGSFELLRSLGLVGH